jgi:hypothetical protein
MHRNTAGYADKAIGEHNRGNQGSNAVTTAVYQTDGGAWTVEKKDEGIYRVITNTGVRGYIERVGAVWVTLEGARLDRSVEVGQSPSLESAASLLAPPC